MGYQKSYEILHLGVLFGVLLVLCAVSFRVPLLSVGGIAVALVCILQARIYYKCPDCGKKLPLWAVMPCFCPECGKKLRDGAE